MSDERERDLFGRPVGPAPLDMDRGRQKALEQLRREVATKQRAYDKDPCERTLRALTAAKDAAEGLRAYHDSRTQESDDDGDEEAAAAEGGELRDPAPEAGPDGSRGVRDP